jgi:uncharacterized protein (TIGR03437 family)
MISIWPIWLLRIAGLVLATFSVQAAVVVNQNEIGSNYSTVVSGVAVDSSGFIYEYGTTTWPGFPTTPGPFGQFTASGRDAFIRKLSPDMGQVIYSVLIGGSGSGGESSAGIAVDPQGNVFITGSTNSADFPVTMPSAHAPDSSGPDVFVLELDPTGTRLIYSRVIGGSGSDSATGIALTPDGRAVITGTTLSPDFPTTPDALQGAAASPTTQSAFVVSLGTDGSILYSTYLAGPGGATGEDIAIDPLGDIYVTGFAGAFFPTLYNSFAPQASYGGYVSKIDHYSGQFVYSTYLPGVESSYVGPSARLAIRVDSTGHAYVAGPASSGFPATAGAFQTEVASDPYARYPGTNAFLLELDEMGGNLIFATLFGGSGDDRASAVAITGDAITIAGITSSPDVTLRDFGLPVCNLISVQYDFGEPYTTFVAQFDHSGKLITSFEYGSCSEEHATALAQGPSTLLLAGTFNYTNSTNLIRSFLISVDMKTSAPVQVQAITDSASFEIGPYAPLELITIFGTGMGPRQGAPATPDSSGIFPTEVAGTRVSIGGQLAPLLYASDSQIRAVVPQWTSLPFANINVMTPLGLSASFTTVIEPASPALFTADGSGIGQANCRNADETPNSPDNPAPRGSTITLYGTGGGQTVPPFPDGQIIPSAVPLSYAQYTGVIIGTEFVPALFAGTAPGYINGFDQITVTIPADAPTGPRVPVVFDIYPYRSQSGVTVAISN